MVSARWVGRSVCKEQPALVSLAFLWLTRAAVVAMSYVQRAFRQSVDQAAELVLPDTSLRECFEVWREEVAGEAPWDLKARRLALRLVRRQHRLDLLDAALELWYVEVQAALVLQRWAARQRRMLEHLFVLRCIGTSLRPFQ